MNELEEAIVICANQTGSEELRSRALAFCNEVTRRPDAWQIAVQEFCSCRIVAVQFWSLNVLLDICRYQLGTLSEEDGRELRQFLGKWLFNLPAKEAIPDFLIAKFIHLFIVYSLQTYPLEWPTFWSDIITNLCETEARRILFCRCLITLDEEAVIPSAQSSAAIKLRNDKVKDAMRQDCIPKVVEILLETVVTTAAARTETAVIALEALSRLIPWIDITLVTTAHSISIIRQCINASFGALSVVALRCLRQLVSKGMDSGTKIQLINSLNVVNDICNFNVEDDDGSGEEFVEALSLLMRSLVGAFEDAILQGNFVVWNEFLQAGQAILVWSGNCAHVSLLGCLLAFSSSVLAIFKKVGPSLMSSEQDRQSMLLQLLTSLSMRNRLTDDFDWALEVDLDRDEFLETRRKVDIAWRAVFRVDGTTGLEFVKSKIIKLSPSSHYVDIEHVLHLVYIMGEVLPQRSSEEVGVILLAAMRSPAVLCCNHILVCEAVMEIAVRYVSLFCSTGTIPLILDYAVGEMGGLKSSIARIQGHALGQLCRILRAKRTELAPFVDRLLEEVSAAQARVSLDHWGMLFEVIGVLYDIALGVGASDVESKYHGIMRPVMDRLHAAALLEAARLSKADTQQLLRDIVAIASISKGGKSLVSRDWYLQDQASSCESVLAVGEKLGSLQEVRDKCFLFMHRMTAVMGLGAVLVLERFIGIVLNTSSRTDMMEILRITSQLISHGNAAALDFCYKSYGPLLTRTFQLISESSEAGSFGHNPNFESDAMDERQRECLELRGVYFLYLHALLSGGCQSVLVTEPNIQLFQTVLHSIYEGAVSSDTAMQKSCLLVLLRMVEVWTTAVGVSPMSPAARAEKKADTSGVLEGFDTVVRSYFVSVAFRALTSLPYPPPENHIEVVLNCVSQLLCTCWQAIGQDGFVEGAAAYGSVLSSEVVQSLMASLDAGDVRAVQVILKAALPDLSRVTGR